MNLYLLPETEAHLKDRIFEKTAPYLGTVPLASHWINFKLACNKRGITVHTYDLWTRDRSRPDDILFVLNGPVEGLAWRAFYRLKHWRSQGGFILKRRDFVIQNHPFFSKRILYHGESPMVTPYVYNHLSALKRSGWYTKIFLTCKGFGDEYGFFNHHLQTPPPPVLDEYFHAPKTKFLTMMNSNIPPHSFAGSLFGERMRAIRYFSHIPDFDFYGHGWNKPPRHPLYLWYKRYVTKAWRGPIDDKMKTLRSYKFSLCFENCSWPGYSADRLWHCFEAGCVPIYLGQPDIAEFVPSSCFIDFRDFKNYDELHAHLRSLTEADLERYKNSMLAFLQSRSNMDELNGILDQMLS